MATDGMIRDHRKAMCDRRWAPAPNGYGGPETFPPSSFECWLFYNAALAGAPNVK
jgi:hypothetical protein